MFYCCYCSVAQLCLSLQPHELQHARLPCPSLFPRACLNSCPLSQRCHPTISSPVTLFSSCLNLSQHQGLFQWIGSSHQVPKVLELQLQPQSFQWMNIGLIIKGWFPLGLTGLISLLSKGLSSLLQHHCSKASVLWCSTFFMVQLSHPHITTGKTIASTRQTFVGKVICLLFNMLSRFVIAFLPRSKLY